MNSFKKVIAAGCMALGVLAGSAYAADISMDGSSRESMQQSVQQIKKTLEGSEKYQFMAALNVISIDEAGKYFEKSGRSPKDLKEINKQDMNAVMAQVMMILDGKTAPEIIELASGSDYAKARQALGELQQKLQKKS